MPPNLLYPETLAQIAEQWGEECGYSTTVLREKDIKALGMGALLAVAQLEKALGLFKEQVGRPASSLEELVEKGMIEAMPSDPYDGKFYLDDSGRVRTTSKFASQDLR